MTDQEDLASMGGFRVRDQPSHGRGAVPDEGGVADLGVKPIVGYSRDIASRGERLPDESVKILRAALPIAAVEEHQQGPVGGGTVGDVEVETLAGVRTVGEV